MTSSILASATALSTGNFPLALLLAKATIILIAALGITRAMQRASATARHLVWLVSLGALLLVPALTAWSPLRLAILPATRPAEPMGVATGRPNFMAVPGAAVTGTPLNGFTASIDAGATTTPVSPPPADGNTTGDIALILAAWAAVALAILGMLGWAGLSVRRIVRAARPLTSPDWTTPLLEIADRIGLDAPPRLLQSDETTMPFACGLVHPTIVLPAEAEHWTLERRRAVLLHELAHVRRHDLLGHTLGRLVCAAYWFHPLAWTAARRLRSESERACDDLALACGTRATDYAEHLLDIVTSVRRESTPLVALAMARRNEFEGRMLAILDPGQQRSAPSRRQSAALIGGLALVALTVGAVAPVARSAGAAVIAAAPQGVAAPVAAPRGAPVASPQRRITYPDSGVRGVQSKRMTYVQSTHVTTSRSFAQSASPSASATTRADASQANAPTGGELAALASASASYGLKVAASVLDALTHDQKDRGARGDKGDKGDKGGGADDDRPILLARVLESDTTASLRRIAAWGLQAYAGTPVADEALAKALRRDADWKVREMAAWALGSATDGPAAAALTVALTDPVAGVRARAAWALGSLSPSRAPKALVAMLRDGDPHVRTLAAWALFTIEDPSTTPAIESALKAESNVDVQLALIRAVAAFGEQSTEAIRGLLESPDARIRTMAVRALAGGHAAGPWPWPEPRPFP